MSYRTHLLTATAAALSLWAAPAAAQQPDQDAAAMMEAWQKAGQPGVQHHHLAKLVGRWQAETKFWMDPTAEPLVSPATMEYAMIMDGRYLEERIEGDFMGQPFKGRGLYGYDNVTGQVQAVWIDAMSTGIYTYTGSINEAGDEIVLKGKYKDPASGEWKENRSVMKIGPDKLHYINYETANGQEVKTMEVTATRVSGSGTGASSQR